MAWQKSVAARNAGLNAEMALIANGVLKVFTGAAPANVAAANSGTTLVTITLPASPFAAASGGVIAKQGTWADASNDNSGNAGHFRIYASDGTTCHFQGTVGTTGAEMIVADISVVAAGTFTINSVTITGGNP